MAKTDSSNARARAEEAQSRARLATDPALRKGWQEIAEAWLAMIGDTAGEHPDRTSKTPRGSRTGPRTR